MRVSCWIQTAIVSKSPSSGLWPGGLLHTRDRFLLNRLVKTALPLILSLMASTSFAAPPPRHADQGMARPAYNIIDMHLHALPADDQGPPPMPICAPFVNWPIRDPNAPPDAYFKAFTNVECPHKLMSPKTDDELRKRTLAVLKKHNILAVASGRAEIVEAWRKEAPENILSAIAFGITDAPTIDALRKLYAQSHLTVLGEVMIEYEGIAVTDPRMEPFYTLAEELNIPIAIHMGPGPPGAAYLGMQDFRMRLSNPLDLEEVLLKHPKMRIYVMHAGWPMLDGMMALMYAHPQVYVDTGVIDYVLPEAEFHRYLKALVDAGMGKRIMYGSDNMVWPQAIEISLRRIETAPYLTAVQKRDILNNNAARFLRLPASCPPDAAAGARR